MKTRTVITRALGAICALAIMSSRAAFAADPPQGAAKAATDAPADTSAAVSNLKEEGKAAVVGNESKHPESPFSKALTKGATTGGVDPHGDSLQSIQHSFQQFAHPEFMLRLLLSLALAVACAWVIAWNPRGCKRANPLAELEERKAFIILGVVGAIVAELSATSPTLAFVIFSIGALLRFRTVLDNPKATGKAILVVVIGLACGMGSWTMAVFVTVFSWLLLYWLDTHLSCEMRIRLDGSKDSKPLQTAVESVLLAHHCRLHGSAISRSNKRIEFLFQMPAGLNRDQLEAEVRAKLPKNDDSRVTIEVV